MTKSFYFPAPLSHLGELPIDRLLVFQDPIRAAGDALLRAHDAQSKFGATQGHDGDTVTLGPSFDGSMGLFRRPVASRKKMRIKGGVTTKHLRRNASTRYLFPSVLFRGEFALMTRLARMVVSGLPHHVTQRGNRLSPTCHDWSMKRSKTPLLCRANNTHCCVSETNKTARCSIYANRDFAAGLLSGRAAVRAQRYEVVNM
jgi:hypothetical protein